jgi:methyl coenzyme M reductase subunit D
MFQRTNQKLTILTGSNADQFLDALHVSFEKALERIRKTSGIARMIILDNEIPKTVSTLASRFAPLVQIRRGILKPGAKINHIIACDSTMIRVEEHHEPLTLDSDADAVKAKVFFDNAEEVKARLGFFDAAWELLGN